MTTSDIRKHAKERAAYWLRKAFDLNSTTLQECFDIAETFVYFDLPGKDEILSDLEFMQKQSEQICQTNSN